MATDFSFMRAYGKLHGVKEGYLDYDIRRARRENAAVDAYSWDEENQRWKKFSELEEKAESGDAEAAELVQRLRVIMR